MISFTPTELLGWIVTTCGLITAVAAVISIFIQIAKKAKAPNQLQDQRIEECEKRLNRIDELLAKDLLRFEKLEDGNRIMQRCMLALLSHNVDGNHTASLIKARDELQEFLINQ